VVTIPLSDDLKINSPAHVRWTHGRTMGLKFVPTLPEKVLTPLSRWVFQRREEDRERMERPLNPLGFSAAPKGNRLVLVSGSEELESSRRAQFPWPPALAGVAPPMAPL